MSICLYCLSRVGEVTCYNSKKKGGVQRLQLGGILREMRKRAGLSQEEMAEALHMSISNISRFENDIYDIKAIDFFKWAKITNNPDVLMAIYAAIDVATQVQPLTQLIIGTILGGIA